MTKIRPMTNRFDIACGDGAKSSLYRDIVVGPVTAKERPMKSAVVAASIVLATAAGPSLALAGPIYGWSWSNPGPGTFSNTGGGITWIETQFDTNTNRLHWTANFGEMSNSLRTSGFTLALTAGPEPHPYAGELAVLYFAAKDVF